jgi:Secretion system C-terminal sorting domain
MKKLYSFIAFYIITSLQAQVINFPDANLKAKLLEADVNNMIAEHNKIDVNENGEIEVAEAQNIFSLDISNSSISNLSGLSYFPLSGFDCSNNLLTSLDGLNQQSLEFLKCDHNQLTELIITTTTLVEINCSYNQLVTLNLSMLPFTDSIEIQNNNLSEFMAPNVVGTLNIRNNNFNGFSVPSFTSIGSNLFFGNNPSDALFYSGSWNKPMNLYYSSATATVVDLSNVPMFNYEYSNGQPDFYFTNCNALETIKLNNGLISIGPNFFGNGGIDIQNCTNLSLICADVGEVNYFNQRLGELGLSGQVQVSIECQLNNQNYEITNVILFPNPVESILNITLSDANELQSTSIYDALGQLLIQNTTSNSIDVSDLTTGTYFISIATEKGVTNQKFIKQ